MRLVTGTEMKRLDQWATDEFGIPALLLMENAGAAIARKAREILQDPAGKQVVVLAGKGNNGGDALVAARHLFEMGAEIRLFLLFEPDEFKGPSLINWTLIEKMELKWQRLNDENSNYLLKLRLNQCDLVLDGIFGTGFTGKPPAHIARAINIVNESGRPVLAIDIPSGLEADTGQVRGSCISARCTVTLAWAKRGLILFPGRKYVGELEVAGISLPRAALKLLDREEQLVDENYVREILPPRDREGHKNSFGHVLVIAGSGGMTGAAYLAAKAALRVGGGMVTACLPSSLAAGFDAALPEVITRGVAETGEKTFAPAAWPEIKQLIKGKKAIVFGPGVTGKEELLEILEGVITDAHIPLVIDADGLNILARHTHLLQKAGAPVVLTPHPGEMSRLMGITTAQVQSARVDIAREAARKFNAVVVLKGADTVTAAPQGHIFINSSGGPVLATAGTGDVLAGAIGGLLAQGLEPAAASLCGVFIHGLAGDLIAQKTGSRGAVAGDVLETLPLALKRLENPTAVSGWETE